MSVYTNRDRQRYITGQELGRGGEGAVYSLADRADLVAKIYHPAQRTAQRQAKLAAMVTKPPVDSCRAFTPPHIALAWPTDLLFAQDRFVGFLMPRIERSPSIFALFNPKLRQLRFPRANGRFLYHTAQNLAAAIYALHSAGCVMGDVNQKNILVTPNALVTLVDADSYQVQGVDGTIYRCPVGVPDYTPPELQGRVLDTVDRQSYHDDFGLGVLIFQLLMGGYHPFTGQPLSRALSEVDQLSLLCIQQGIFPYVKNMQVQPPADAPRLTWLHPDLQQLFLQCFLAGHTQPQQRPSALAWARALHTAEQALVQCHRHPAHWYDRHVGSCPYCQQKHPPAAATPRKRHAIMFSTTQPAPRVVASVPPATQSDWWRNILKVLAAVYLLPFAARLLWSYPLVFAAIALIGTLIYPPSRQVVWPVLKTLGMGSWSLTRNLGVALVRLVETLVGFWQTRPPRFKRLVLIMAAITLFWGVMGRDVYTPQPLVVDAQPWVSPLVTPASGGTQFVSPLR